MAELSIVKQQEEPLVEEPAPEEQARERVVREVADDARIQPEQWLRDAEVPKGGE